MKKEIAEILDRADTTGWKEIRVEFGDEFLEIRVPPQCVTLGMKKMPCLANSKDEIARFPHDPGNHRRQGETGG